MCVILVLSADGINYECLSPYVQNQEYVVVARMTVTNQITATDDITVTCLADNAVPPSQSEEIVIDIEGKQIHIYKKTSLYIAALDQSYTLNK